MKKRILLASMAALLLAANVQVMGQTDITPSGYVFANQPEGLYKIDEALTGANPASNYQPVLDKFHNGYVLINNGQFQAGIAAAPNAMYIQSGTSIVDMGAGIGKVLCIKGASSTFAKGIAASGTFGIGWWNMSFFTAKENTPDIETLITAGKDEATATKEATVRMTVVFKIIENKPDLVNPFFSTRAYTFSNDANAANSIGFRSGDFIKRYEDDGSPMEDEDGNMIYDESLWLKHEVDFAAKESKGIPMRIALAFANQTKLPNAACLIKSISFVVNPSGAAVEKQIVRFDLSSTDRVNTQSVQCFASDGMINLTNLNAGTKVAVYGMDGNQAAVFVAKDSNESLNLANGFYIVKAGNQSFKVSVR